MSLFMVKRIYDRAPSLGPDTVASGLSESEAEALVEYLAQGWSVTSGWAHYISEEEK